jgi:glycosyltransferase involved in cell wall biosynthesis
LNEINREVDLFHGLSNELPFGIHTTKVKKVVTIHDLIFECYPEQYKKNDVLIYRKKFKYACQSADKIIAISESTKKDIIELYHIDENKINVCYQSCDERFYTCSTDKHKSIISEKYGLQSPYILSVGSIIERKNLLQICKAFNELQKELDLILVIIGKGNGEYKAQVLKFIHEHNLNQKVKFLEDQYSSQDIYKDLPTIYQNAKAFVYPSIKEGFGIPILEAMASGTAVVTSNVSSLIEAGGDAAITVNPNSVIEIKKALSILCTNEVVRQEYISKGFERAKLFNNKNTCDQVMNLYKELILKI